MLVLGRTKIKYYGLSGSFRNSLQCNDTRWKSI